MLFMVVERRMLPAGVIYLQSWADRG